MTDTLLIVGYVEGAECAHCNRELRHGIRIDDGSTVGAACFARALTAPLVYKGKPYRLEASAVISLAKRAHAPQRFGLRAENFLFVRAA